MDWGEGGASLATMEDGLQWQLGVLYQQTCIRINKGVWEKMACWKKCVCEEVLVLMGRICISRAADTPCQTKLK